MLVKMEHRNKKAEMSLDKIILLILGVLVLIFAVILLTDSNILSWIKNLPGAQGVGDSVRELSVDEKKALDYQAVAYLTLEVERSYFGSGKERYIDFCADMFSCNTRVESPVYFEASSGKSGGVYGALYISRKGMFNADKEIGIIEDNRVKLTISKEDYLALKSESAGMIFPDFSLLERFDGSKYLGESFFYKSNSELQNELKDYKNKIDTLKLGTSNELEIIFTIGNNDYAYVKWDFVNNKALAYIKPDNDQTKIAVCDTFFAISNLNYCYMNALINKIETESKNSIQDLLNSATAQEFAENIFNNFVKNENYEVKGLTKEASISEVNNKLFGVDYLPKENELNSIILLS